MPDVVLKRVLSTSHFSGGDVAVALFSGVLLQAEPIHRRREQKVE